MTFGPVSFHIYIFMAGCCHTSSQLAGLGSESHWCRHALSGYRSDLCKRTLLRLCPACGVGMLWSLHVHVVLHMLPTCAQEHEWLLFLWLNCYQPFVPRWITTCALFVWIISRFPLIQWISSQELLFPWLDLISWLSAISVTCSLFIADTLQNSFWCLWCLAGAFHRQQDYWGIC